VIGAGPAGLAAGHELLARGFSDFTIFEATDAVGGTWNIHTYPGLACDVWAHSYTFSYRPNPDWTASFAEQPEIKAYLETCAQEFGLSPHIRLSTPVTAMRYRDDGAWELRTGTGETAVFDAVINAMGNQHTPLYPNVPGIDRFAGPSFHGTRWNHDVDLAGRRVAVIGSAASAVQIVPEVAKVAAHLTVLQRSANWIMPRRRKLYSPAQRARFRRFPFLLRATQRFQRFLMGFVQPAVTLGNKRMEDFEKMARKFIERSIADPELRRAVTPTSRYGCKRGLVSDDFYPALVLDHVELVAEGLAEVRPEGITTESGREIDVDVIIYCTGYRVLDYDRIEVVGEGGGRLAEAMGSDPFAYKGLATPGFPNLFFAVGPNGLILNVPYFVTVEKNVETIVRLLAEAEDAGLAAISADPERTRAYNASLDERFPLYSWGSGACSSYYVSPSGRPPFLFPGDFKAWSALQDAIGLAEFEQHPRV
jgi:cyclohexanone monooxygenase